MCIYCFLLCFATSSFALVKILFRSVWYYHIYSGLVCVDKLVMPSLNLFDVYSGWNIQRLTDVFPNVLWIFPNSALQVFTTSIEIKFSVNLLSVDCTVWVYNDWLTGRLLLVMRLFANFSPLILSFVASSNHTASLQYHWVMTKAL